MTNFEKFAILCMIGVLLGAIAAECIPLEVMFWFGIVVCLLAVIVLWLVNEGFDLIEYWKKELSEDEA